MKERPILFSGPMVRAILAGEKMQTRRVVKKQPDADTAVWRRISFSTNRNRIGHWLPLDVSELIPTGKSLRCPYGAIGDHLWVKESVRYNAEHDNFYYEADNAGAGDRVYGALHRSRKNGRRTSLFLPRIASRITLEITGVRVERLQAISEADAIAEGCDNSDGAATQELSASARGAYALLWDTINAKRAPWESNPWVWVVSFKRIEQSAVRNAA